MYKNYVVFWPSFLIELFFSFSNPINEIERIFKQNKVKSKNMVIVFTNDLKKNIYNYIPYHLAKDVGINTIKKEIDNFIVDIENSYKVIEEKEVLETLNKDDRIKLLEKNTKRVIYKSAYKNNSRTFKGKDIYKSISEHKDNTFERLTESIFYIYHGDLIRNLPLVFQKITLLSDLFTTLMITSFKNILNGALLNEMIYDIGQLNFAVNTIKRTERYPFNKDIQDDEVLDYKKDLLCFFLFKLGYHVYLFDHISYDEHVFNNFLEDFFRNMVKIDNNIKKENI